MIPKSLLRALRIAQTDPQGPVYVGVTVLEKSGLGVDGRMQRLHSNPAHPDQPVLQVSVGKAARLATEGQGFFLHQPYERPH